MASTVALTAIEKHITAKLADTSGCEDAFFLIDLECLVDKYNAWRAAMPLVEPYYAVKCNPNPAVLHVLDRLGTGFDCASWDEMEKCLDMGVAPERLIFANPCKLESHIAYARTRGVKRMTFDNEDELIKIARIFPEAELVLRIVTDDSKSMCAFSSKFGCFMCNVKGILQCAQSHKAKIIGVSFHVGSGCSDPSAFAKAVNDAADIFEMGKLYGQSMNFLDIGGGFQGADGVAPLLCDVAANVNPHLKRFPTGTKFIAEPGRYFVTKSHTCVVRIHSRRIMRDEEGKPIKVLYYVNDGVYQSFNCIVFDHQHPVPHVLPDASKPGQLANDAVKIPSTVFGPTCDSLDCLCKDYPMPLLDVGQWMYFDNMGAYTTAASTRFNGFSGASTCHYMWGPQFIENFFTIVAGELPGLPPRAETPSGMIPSDAGAQRLPVLQATVAAV